MRLQDIANRNVATIGPDESADSTWFWFRRRRLRRSRCVMLQPVTAVDLVCHA